MLRGLELVSRIFFDILLLFFNLMCYMLDQLTPWLFRAIFVVLDGFLCGFFGSHRYFTCVDKDFVRKFHFTLHLDHQTLMITHKCLILVQHRLLCLCSPCHCSLWNASESTTLSHSCCGFPHHGSRPHVRLGRKNFSILLAFLFISCN